MGSSKDAGSERRLAQACRWTRCQKIGIDRDVHGRDVLDSQTLLDEGDDHLELPAFASVTRIGDRYWLAGGILVYSIAIVLVQGSHDGGEGERIRKEIRKRTEHWGDGVDRDVSRDRGIVIKTARDKSQENTDALVVCNGNF